MSDPAYQPIFDAIDRAEPAMIDTFRTLIGIDTTVPPGRNYDRLVDAVAPRFAAMGWQTERVLVPEPLWRAIPLPLDGPRVNLVARSPRFGETGREKVTFYAHMDVVPIEEGWTKDPFGRDIEDGRAFGRGASDMKGSIVSLLHALETLHAAGVQPRYDITVCLCTDEEIGVYPGIWHLAKQGYVQGFLWCMEGGQDPNISLCSAGSVDVTVATIGRSAHSGRNYAGINAIDAMVPILQELLVLKAEVERRESSVPRREDPAAPSGFVTPMFNLSVLRAGAKSNIVPSRCELIVNRRYIPEERFEDVVEEIRTAIERGRARGRSLDVEVQVMHNYPAVKYPAERPHLHKVQEAAEIVHGYRPEDWRAAGGSSSTDMAYVAQELPDMEIFSRGPGRRDGRAHGRDEFVRLEGLRSLCKEIAYVLAF